MAEYENDGEIPVLEMRVGIEEAQLLASGVGFLLSDMVQREAWLAMSSDERDERDYMNLLEHRMVATQMFRGLWTALGIPEEDTDHALENLDTFSDICHEEALAEIEGEKREKELAEARADLAPYRRRQRWIAVAVAVGLLVNAVIALDFLQVI